MDKIKKNFGFGCMRLPMAGEDVDIEQTKRMVDAFLEAGFNYFDTAHGYIQEKSEPALRKCLTERYPRSSFILTDKLSGNYFERQEDIRPLFETQLEACGVEYFDFYLMHAQSANSFKHFKQCRAYETAFELKAEGKIRHVGISFHDSPEQLDRILTEYPQIEVVQIQFNYADFNDPNVQSFEVYNMCRRHGKPIIVMEPVKGGNLADLPDDAAAVLAGLNGGSSASYAVRFAAGFDGMMMVLSGMSSMEQMLDNISFMKDFKPLSAVEQAAVSRVQDILCTKKLIACTGCRYCTAGCPMQIAIPDLFSIVNKKELYRNWNTDFAYRQRTSPGHMASDCIKCGQCEQICPQHLDIRSLLEDIAERFEA